VLALWSTKGGLDKWYRDAGGPLQLWREWADDVTGYGLNGGHFFPEEKPEEVASVLSGFFEGIALAHERV
jgi:haloacetate dehalogenase